VRILIAGASGRTGHLLTRLALERGHEVTAFVRDKARMHAAEAEALHVVEGDVLEPDTLRSAIRGHDAIASVVAPRPRRDGRVYVEGTRNLANAAVAAGVRRFVVVSAEGAGVARHRVPLGYRLVMRIPVVARLYPDIAQMERELAARTDLDWTIVAPPVLTNRSGSARFRVSTDAAVSGGLWLPRADLAAFLLETIERGTHVGERVAIAR